MKCYFHYPVLIVSPALRISSRSYDETGNSFGVIYLGFRRKSAVIDVESKLRVIPMEYLDSYLEVQIISNLEYWVRIEVMAKARNIPVLLLLRKLKMMNQLEIDEYLKSVNILGTQSHLIGYAILSPRKSLG